MPLTDDTYHCNLCWHASHFHVGDDGQPGPCRWPGPHSELTMRCDCQAFRRRPSAA